MDKSAATDALVQFICDNYLVEKEEVPLDKSLIDEAIIDSFGLIEIASFLENHFSIKIQDNDLIRENFGSIEKMIAFAAGKKTSAD